MIYYNENDPVAAAWLRELIADNLIAPGAVDERSIADVHPDDVRGFTQCHFFAGIGVWSYALRKAGWPDDRPVWTGSCPCQPFSSAGGRKGIDDDRHLWPVFLGLIQSCRPLVVLGEQVASSDVIGKTRYVHAGKDSTAWLDIVLADLEDSHYTSGAIVTPSSGIGAPHIRQRTWWMGVTGNGGMAHSTSERLKGGEDTARQGGRDGAEFCGNACGVGYFGASDDSGRPGPVNGFWSDADWLFCRDGKWRPVKPGALKMAYGAARGMVPGSDSGASIIAKKAGKEIDANVQAVPLSDHPEAVLQRGSGVPEHDESEEILRSEMHGQMAAGQNEGAEFAQQPSTVSKESEIRLRDVRCYNEAPCPPQGRGADEQQPVQLADVVREMPQGSTLASLFCARGQSHMQALREASDESRPLLDAQYPLEVAWRSLGEEDKDRIEIHFAQGNYGWVREAGMSPLVNGPARGVVRGSDQGAPINPDKTNEVRVMRLRGYGNAINAEAATVFVQCVIDILDS